MTIKKRCALFCLAVILSVVVTVFCIAVDKYAETGYVEAVSTNTTTVYY